MRLAPNGDTYHVAASEKEQMHKAVKMIVAEVLMALLLSIPLWRE